MKKILFSILSLLLLGVLAALFSNDAFIFVFSDKIWAHRVNSIQKKKEALGKFSGIELDLMYYQEKGMFDVNHFPASSINLSLSDYLKADTHKNSGYWLDFKNLTAENAQSACNIIDSIVRSLDLNKEKIIVESPNYPFLHLFAAKGFIVSYYLPCLHTINHDSLVKTVDEVRSALRKYPGLRISSEYKDYQLMKHYFPDANKLLWWTGPEKSFWNWRRKFALYRMMSDRRVDVLLVPFHPTSEKMRK